MDKRKRVLATAVFLAVVCLSLVLVWTGDLRPVGAAPNAAARYVAVAGGASTCSVRLNNDPTVYTTVQAAVDASTQVTDVVKVSGYCAGVSQRSGITQTVYLNKSLTLRGGYRSDFAAWNPGTYPTTLDAQGQGRVIYIAGSNVTPTIEGFVLTGGNASSDGADGKCGGAIFGKNVEPVIQSNILINNVADVVTGTGGAGGGIYLYGGSTLATIRGNQILSNTANNTDWERGGGGIALDNSDATVAGNLIAGNTCNHAGGGIYSRYGSPQILDNEIRDNTATSNGGGFYSRYDVAPFLQGNLIISNTTGGNNGGIYITTYTGTPTVDRNRILSNTGTTGGGIGLSGYFTVTNNIIAYNNGGGIRLGQFTNVSLIAYNTIYSNTGSDGGINVAYASITPTIVNNIIVANSYGIRAHTNASGTIDYNDVWGNITQDYDLPGALQPGANDIQVNPRFFALPLDNFHLVSGSLCIDAATDIGITVDIDGEPRPSGGGYEMGAHEYWGMDVYLPLVLRNSP